MSSDQEIVASIPRRIAHVVHALIESSGPYAYGPGFRRTAEVLVYDSESYSVASTRAALSRGLKRGLVDRVGVRPAFWFPTNRAMDLRIALEERFLADTERDDDR